jgi:N,N'-diacetyllegionaminate synthase
MSVMKIFNHKINSKAKPFIIAEAGINHNGSIKKALKMVELAKASNVDAIKFQTYNSDEFISDKKKIFKYKLRTKFVSEPMYNIFKRCEFSEKNWKKIKRKCDKEKIIFLSTPSDFKDLRLILKLKVPAIKIGSDDFTNIPLIKMAKKSKLPLILSSGMSTLKEIETTLKYSGALNGYPVILMLCVSRYPTPPEDVNIKRLNYLKSKYPKITLGFSDHTEGFTAASLAVAYGATFFEKHFTLNKLDSGPDHWFSEDKKSLGKWVQTIKDSFTMLGKSKNFPIESEKKMRLLARKSIVASKGINKGEIINSDNVCFKRPGTGLPPIKYMQILGLKSKIFIRKNRQIELNLLKK